MYQTPDLKFIRNVEENLLPKITAGRWRFSHLGNEGLGNCIVDLEGFFKRGVTVNLLLSGVWDMGELKQT